jgi:hypothetical protein
VSSIEVDRYEMEGCVSREMDVGRKGRYAQTKGNGKIERDGER